MLRFFIPLFLFPIILSAQSSLNMGVVGSYNYTNNECSDIWGYVDPTGTEYAQLVGLLDGFSVVDLSNPSNPSQNFYPRCTIYVERYKSLEQLCICNLRPRI